METQITFKMETKDKSKTLTDEAYHKIKQLILNQELIPGQKLIYDDLAKRLDMSRTPIINALNRLEQHGVVVSQSHRGFTVRPIHTKEAFDTYCSREAIETYAVEQVILNADYNKLSLLEEKMQNYENYKPNYYDRKKIYLDAAVHLQLVELTNNSVLRYHLKLDLQHIYLRAKLNNYSFSRMNESVEEHRQLLQKIKDRDVQGAVQLMRDHILREKKHVVDCLTDNEKGHDHEDGVF